jgi:hypothetical protein
MAIPHAEALIKRAREGERLGTKDRRHCIAFLMAADPGHTNVSLGELFKVSERQIRDDKLRLRQERAKLVKEEDVGLVIADIALAFENQLRDIETSKRKAKLGSGHYLNHCKTVCELIVKKIQVLQELGYLPKNLGQMTHTKYEYKATVDKMTGAVDTRPVHMTFDDSIEDGEFEEVVTTRQLSSPGSQDGESRED